MKPPASSGDTLPILPFRNQEDWTEWLHTHHSAWPGVWLRLAKKGSGIESVSYAEALEAALCYGWIDGQKRRGHDKTWIQKFTPRAKKSIWSKINRGKALALIEAGRMHTAGLREVERAQQDGRWDRAYDSPAAAAVPDDFQAALDRNARAKAHFVKLDRANRFAFLFRVQTARPQARARKIQELIRMLEEKQKFH